MNAQVFIITLMTATVALMSALPAAVDPPVIDKSLNPYEAHINKYVSRCQTKEKLLNNLKLKNIQKIVTQTKKKAAFFSENKEQLISEMIERKIGEKQYLIKLYLDKRFQEMIPANDITPSQTIATLGI